MNTMLPLNELEAVLRDNGTVDEEMLRMIIKENAQGGGLLRKAAEEGYLNILKFFLEAKDKFELTAEEMEACSYESATDKEGNSLLHIAATNGYVYIVQYIISSEERFGNMNRLRETPLYLACREGHESVVQLLLSPQAFGNTGKAPIDIAATNGHVDLVRLLLNAGRSRGRALSCAAEAGHTDVVALILERCADITLLDLENLALHEAARMGHIHILEMLLNAGGDTSRINKDGYTPMALAAEHGHTNIVQLLLSHETGAEPPNSVDKSPLDCAVSNGHIGIARLLLLHGFTLNTTFLLGRMVEKGRHLATLALLAMGEDFNAIKKTSALHIACAGKQLDMLHFLLQRKMYVNVQDDLLNTPLHTACKYACNESIINLLIDHGANVNALNRAGCTPLLCAKDLPLQGLLIERGGDPHIPNNMGKTLLHMATSVESVQLLLQCNVLVDARDIGGMTPLMAACLQNRVDVAEKLVEHGACINTKNHSGESPLFKAICRSSNGCVKFLLENGAHVNSKEKKFEQTPLHIASWRNNFKGAQLLLRWGASVNARDFKGSSPLYSAAESDAFGVMQLLIEYGAHVKFRNYRGQTPLHVAISEEGAKILRRKCVMSL